MDNSQNKYDEEPLLEAPAEEPLIAAPEEEKLIPAHLPHSNKPTIIRVIASFVGLFVLVAIAYAIYTLFSNTGVPPTQSNPTPTIAKATNTPVPTEAPISIPSDWLEYRSADGTYNISYPPTFTPSCSDVFSCQFNPTQQVGTQAPSFVYISLVPPTANPVDGSIYNYTASESGILESMQIGETKVSRPNRESPELDAYYKWTRLPDTKIDGEVAKVFENTRPWEFPTGTTEKRYLIRKENGTLYLIGAYINPNGISEDTARTITHSVRFLQ